MKRNSNVIEQQVDNEILVIPVIDGVAQMKQVCCLSESGVYIWQNIPSDKNVSAEEIVNLVSNHYNVPSEEVENDVLEFIDLMKQNKIVL